MTTPAGRRCDVTELLAEQCAHCKRNTDRDARQPKMFTAPPRGADRPPVLEAKHYGRCSGCDDSIEPGEYITKTDDDTWVHVGCDG